MMKWDILRTDRADKFDNQLIILAVFVISDSKLRVSGGWLYEDGLWENVTSIFHYLDY